MTTATNTQEGAEMTDRFEKIKEIAGRARKSFGNEHPDDLEAAHAIAAAVHADYSPYDRDEFQRFMAKPWNDDVAVQTALAVMKMARSGVLPSVKSRVYLGDPL